MRQGKELARARARWRSQDMKIKNLFTNRLLAMPSIQELKSGDYRKKKEETNRIIGQAQKTVASAFEKANILEGEIAKARISNESQEKINAIWEQGVRDINALRSEYGR